MEENLKQDIARYIYPFFSNNNYNNKEYYNMLVKKYGRSVVNKAIKEEKIKGTISDAFGSLG